MEAHTLNEDTDRAERLLSAHRVDPQQVVGFRFMQRHTAVTGHSTCNKYGAGILVLEIADGAEKVLILHPRHNPGSVVRALLAWGIPFQNYHPAPRQDKTPAKAAFYRHASLRMFWYGVMLVLCLLLSGKLFIGGAADGWEAWQTVFAVLWLAFGGAYLYFLLTRFYYLELDGEGLSVHRLGKKVTYPYAGLRKANFDFAHEASLTLVMELLDKDYNYHLFYIGRVPRARLGEITARLQEAGIDTTCSLSPQKLNCHDVHRPLQ